MSRPDLKGKIQTVLGPIEPGKLGRTLMHEHVLCDIRPPGTRSDNDLGPEITLENVWQINYGRGIKRAGRKYMLDLEDIATREVAGIHSMGSGAGRAMGSVKDLLPGGSSSVTEGVSVEVGSTQAAADLSIVTEYGMAIQDVAQAVRDNVIRRVQQMTGLEMVEVNIAVTDVNVPTKSAGTPSVPGASSGRQQRVQ